MINNVGFMDEEIFKVAQSNFEKAEWVILHSDMTVTGPSKELGMVLFMTTKDGGFVKLLIKSDDMKQISENWMRGKAAMEQTFGQGVQT